MPSRIELLFQKDNLLSLENLLINYFDLDESPLFPTICVSQKFDPETPDNQEFHNVGKFRILMNIRDEFDFPPEDDVAEIIIQEYPNGTVMLVDMLYGYAYYDDILSLLREILYKATTFGIELLSSDEAQLLEIAERTRQNIQETNSDEARDEFDGESEPEIIIEYLSKEDALERIHDIFAMKNLFKDFNLATARKIIEILPKAHLKYTDNGGRWGPGVVASTIPETLNRSTVSKYLRSFYEAGIRGISYGDGENIPIPYKSRN